MEAATISSPQRKLNVVPVQKSLSLPSYARAGGEGIDHRIIFAALEQREKIRRKSRIFAREKSARQNIFCLPISSGNKCRETSLSSDTSCSSLEYQKPKTTSKLKKDEKKPTNETTVNEIKTAKTNQIEAKSSQIQNVEPKVVEVEPELQKNSLKFEPRKEPRSPPDTLRFNVNSSDSMERSSRSSNDSLSRKERLVAIKAKVEAAREKYGDTSSEDENRSSITRYNSDGVIHRSVREVKAKSYRMEKKLRRRSQDEYALKKANRKNNLSLCLNSLEDGIKLDLDRSLNIFDDSQNTECKTDFCPSPNVFDFTKKNYFSDFPSKENISRSVQARVKHIEEEERKRRSSSDFRDKTKISSRQSPQSMESSSPFSTQRRNAFSNQNALSSLDMEKTSPSSDVLHCPSPVGRAPTPPPRSPKSITFVNKVYKQHQNSYLNNDCHSLERKLYFHPNIPVTSQTKYTDKANSNDSKTGLEIFDDTKERRKMRELFNARRKTCSYFDYSDNFTFKELNSSTDKATAPKSLTTTGLNIPQSTDAKGYFSSSEIPGVVSEDPKRRLWRSKWDETEKRHECMFNSLESKKKSLSPSWMKWSATSQEKEQCLCQIVSGHKYCTCNNARKNIESKLSTSSSISDKIESASKNVNGNQSFRLSKSEMNIAYAEQTKLNSENILRDLPTLEKPLREQHELTDKGSATANLDSAMEELESVYRSLKFSSDNLSVRNSSSNLSLNDLNAETSRNDSANQRTTDLYFKQSSTKENNFNLHNTKLSNSKTANDKKPLESLKLSIYSPNSEINSNSLCKSPETENICIDELFNDLTRQLDIEQKLLKESRENRQENKTPDLQNRRDNRTLDTMQSNKFEKRDQKRMTPLESIVSIRKELFDNLQKNSQEQMRSYSPASKLSDKAELYQLEMAKKKCKAVRSLSENISYLMASTNPNPIVKKLPSEKMEPYISNMETFLEKTTPKQYDHIILEPHKAENKKEAFYNHPFVPKRTHVIDKHKKPIAEEIRQIRVSMDSNSSDSSNILKKDYSEYPRLTSAVCRPQLSPKTENTPSLVPTSSSKETSDVLDENGLEKLLNTLLNDVPDPKQSSLMKSREDAPPTPPPVSSAGKNDHVKFKRNILPLRMDSYMTAASKGQVKTSDCSQVLKSEEVAQVKSDYHQNSAHFNQVSFIPVYASKNVCHKFSKVNNECENQSDNITCERKVMSTYSPPARPRCTGDKDILSARIAKTHMRRRSVGFEDMMSLTSYYGHNYTNDRRFQGSINSNISQHSAENHSTFLQSDNALPTRKLNQKENSCFSSWNHNAQISSGANANDQLLRRLEKPFQQCKDKSSKRKSSLNRMDFINFSPSKTGSNQYPSDFSQKNSSSDEESESRFPVKRIESPIGTSKRKHSGSHIPSVSPKPEVKTREVTLKNSSFKMKSNLPKSSPTNHSNSRQIRWKHSSKMCFSQKLSHSAGELESLTDYSEVPNRNKTYMSAQEFDDQGCSRVAFNSETLYGVTAKSGFQKSSPKHTRRNENSSPLKNACDSTSQIDNKKEFINDGHNLISKEDGFDDLVSSRQVNCNIGLSKDTKENISSETHSVQNNPCSDSVNSDFQKDCDSSTFDVEIETSAIKLESLNITDTNSKSTDASADESGDGIGSDGEKRRGSILRKKTSEEKKELHSILKMPPEEKLLRTPPSILKHRESSEEKDSWQPNDYLHSILKKSTSEDESCNSGPDIRPILKLSTDEDSPSGYLKPRPILKKRTSFSDECSYVSFPSGELKPILKKKTPLSSEDQPKPILKSRRKSEDSRSTTSEIITSRPRAYSADMGVKMNHESQTDNSDVKNDFRKLDSHDL